MEKRKIINHGCHGIEATKKKRMKMARNVILRMVKEKWHS